MTSQDALEGLASEGESSPPPKSVLTFHHLPAELRVMIYQNTFGHEEYHDSLVLEHMLNLLVPLQTNSTFFSEAAHEFVRHATIVLSFESFPRFLESLLRDEYVEVWEALPVVPKVRLVPNAYVHAGRGSFPKGRKRLQSFASFASKVRNLTIDFPTYPEYLFDNQGYVIWDFERFRNLNILRIIFPVSQRGLEELAQSRLGDAIEKANQFLGVPGKLSSVQYYGLPGSLTVAKLRELRRKQQAVDRHLLRRALRQVSAYRIGLKHFKFYPDYWLADWNLPWEELLTSDLFDLQIRLGITQTEEWFWAAEGEGFLGYPPKNFLDTGSSR
ncbi:uncharacterized protein PAC_00907 [Phialocephala subalpina]|uniref:Uncharacterized protein n=1 Tax=Phialocephala subalpina TaxID=576137 RepID=A0A1L7WE21_9HELO|nr:uncharacterized protein PAC_00907 [Phialocephala subalpina]